MAKWKVTTEKYFYNKRNTIINKTNHNQKKEWNLTNQPTNQVCDKLKKQINTHIYTRAPTQIINNKMKRKNKLTILKYKDQRNNYTQNKNVRRTKRCSKKKSIDRKYKYIYIRKKINLMWFLICFFFSLCFFFVFGNEKKTSTPSINWHKTSN